MVAELLKQFELFLSFSAWVTQLFLFVHSCLQKVREKASGLFLYSIAKIRQALIFFALSCMNSLIVHTYCSSKAYLKVLC